MVRVEWFARYHPESLDRKFDQIVQSWDTANKPSELADYSVGTTWGFRKEHFYLLNVFRKKLGYPDLKRAVREQHRLFGASTVLIEDKASGTQLIQELVEEGLSGVRAMKSEGDKIMRLHAQTATIENGFVHLPASAPWLADYLHELTSSPMVATTTKSTRPRRRSPGRSSDRRDGACSNGGGKVRSAPVT